MARTYNRVLSEDEIKENYNYDNNKYNISEDYFEKTTIVDNKYTIASVEDLKTFRDQVNNGKDFSNTYIEITKDLDLSEITNWVPIGTETIAFNGILDGNNHKISNLKVDNANSYQGLFGNNAGTIENLNIESGTIKGTIKVGAIAGNNSGAILNCTNSATIDATSYHIGGICGYSKGNIQRCTNIGTISSNKTSVGGIVGRVEYGIIKYCSNLGKITSTSSDIAGICGSGVGVLISSCSNTGEISTTGYNDNKDARAGGILGGADVYSKEKSIIKSCYNTQSIIGAGSTVGGIAGTIHNTDISCCYNIGNITSSMANNNNNAYAAGISGEVYDNSSNIEYCYNTGTVTCLVGTNKYLGGIAGDLNTGSSISNSYTLSTKISTIIGRNNGGTSTANGAKTENDMKTAEFVTLLGGNYNWTLLDSFPRLRWE